MRFSQRFLQVGAMAVAIAALSGCAAGGVSAAGSSPSAETVTFGAVLPLTGSSATIGEDQRRGIELAVEDINAAGGVDGKKLRVSVEDSQGTAAGGLDAARKLVSVEKVPVVLGEYASGVTIPVGSYLQAQGAVHFNIGSSSPEIAKIGDFSFSTIGLDTLASKFAAQNLRDAGHKKAVLIAPNNAYGEGVANTLKSAFEKLGGTVATTILFTEGQSDYRAELQRAQLASPDVYVYSAYGQDAAVINQQAFELGLSKTPWYAIYLTMCTSNSDPAVVEGQTGMDVNYTGTDGDAYVAAYKAKYGEGLASSFSAYAYDAVRLAAQAIEDGGSADAASIRTALANRTKAYSGVTGPIAFNDQNQRTEQPYAVLSITNGVVTAAKQ